MNAFATSAFAIVYGCGHLVNVANGDEVPMSCPRCYPIAGSDYRIPDTRYDLVERETRISPLVVCKSCGGAWDTATTSCVDCGGQFAVPRVSGVSMQQACANVAAFSKLVARTLGRSTRRAT